MRIPTSWKQEFKKIKFRIMKKLRFWKLHQFWKLSIIKYIFLNNIEQEIKKIADNKNIVFMIILPNMLHIADIAIKCVPNNMNLVLIMTGVKRWEFEFAKKRYNPFKMIYSKYIFPHSIMIDTLIDNLKYPFILLDHDCFVFNKDYFNEINSIKNNEGILSFYCYFDNKFKLNVPQTFFMVLNPVLLQGIKKKYGVDSSNTNWNSLSGNVKKEFQKLIIKKNFRCAFDTLRVLFLLCLTKGRIRFMKKYKSYDFKDMFHIGGAAHGGKEGVCLNGKYISSKILETIADPYLKKRYKKYKDKKLGKSEDLLLRIPLNKNEAFFRFSKELFKKLDMD